MLGITYAHGPRKRSTLTFGIPALVAALVLALVLQIGPVPGRTPWIAGAVDLSHLPLQFEPNVGQTNSAVNYMVHAPGGTLYFSDSEVVLALQSRQSRQDGATALPAVRLQFLGVNPAANLRPEHELQGKVNYQIGNDAAQWHTAIPTYDGISYSSLYPGIDLKYDGQGGQLKGTYIVAPGAEADAIRWRYSGAQQTTVDAEGNLQIAVGSGASAAMIIEVAPAAWQTLGGKQVPVGASYRVAGDGSIGFTLGAYDTTQPLIIDPALTFSTYLGGNNLDQGTSIATDAAGNIYVAGYTASTDFPVANALQPALAGGNDAFITKLQPDGTMVYSTYLGGSGGDEARGIAVDTAGAVYVAGVTVSANFPTHNAYQAARPGGTSSFLAKLSPDGASLAYATYFGGTAFTDAWGVAADGSNGAYITGRTSSTNLPVRNAYQGTYGGTYDVFLARFNTAASGDVSLVYSTYLGGSGNEYVGSTGYGLGDWGHGIAADAAGNAYVAGQSFSTNFPVRSAFQSTLNGINDAFVTKVNTAAAGDASLIYSTYLGSTGQDAAKDVDVDALGNAYVTGGAGTSNFPTLNPYMPCVNGSPFVTKLNTTGSALVYSTCFGSGGVGKSADIAVDAAGRAYIVGTTSSATFPVVNPIQPVLAGPSDAFVVKLVPAGNNVVYSTYLGGTSYEEGMGVAAGDGSNTYVSGDTRSADFPVHNPIQGTCASCPDQWDAFISAINESQPAPTATPTRIITPTTTPVNTPSPTATLTFTPVPGDQPPVITVPLNWPYIVGVEIGNYLALRFDATDPDVGDTVRFSISGLPSGASFPIPVPGNPIHSTLTWRPTAADIGTYFVTVIATDSHGAQDAATVQIDVVPGCVPYFSDVFTTDYFYPGVQYLFCHLVISGYIEPDLTFTYRPYNNTTRGQFSKMVVGAYQLPPYNPPTPDFIDVPVGSTFYSYIEAAFHAGIVNGYPDHTFRPAASITRGQLSKLVVRAAEWPIDTSGGPHFSDVTPGSTFYEVIETAYHHNVISGYPCGGPGEPCDPQQHAYFRVGNPSMRGQIAKILWLALGSPAPR